MSEQKGRVKEEKIGARVRKKKNGDLQENKTTNTKKLSQRKELVTEKQAPEPRPGEGCECGREKKGKFKEDN